MEIHVGMVPQRGYNEAAVMNRSRTPSGAVLLWILLAGLGCSPQEQQKESGFRVRLLTSGALSGRWEHEAERGLGLIAAKLDAEVARTRASGGSDQRARLRAHAEEGIDLVFCVGPDVESTVYTEAPAFPDTDFVVIPGEIHADNVASISFMPEEAGYLAGAIAAAVADKPAVGVIRGSGRSWLDRLESGFAAGVRERYPSAVLATVRGESGPWELVGSEIRVALYSTDRIEPRVLAAAHNAGLLLIGADPALLSAEPDLVVATVHVDVAEAMLRVAREVHDRHFVGQIYTFDLGSGVLDVTLNPDAQCLDVKGKVRYAFERARSEITAGWVEIEELGIGR
jgi:basic membrane lipoprotein Med (substrate-binding protein (PBP1-ABC) superfamily)